MYHKVETEKYVAGGCAKEKGMRERASPNLTTLSLAGALYPPHFPCVCEKCRENFTLVSCCFFFVVRTNIKTKSKREGVRERERERTYFYVRLVGGKNQDGGHRDFRESSKVKNVLFSRSSRAAIFDFSTVLYPRALCLLFRFYTSFELLFLSAIS